jgi:DNA primase
MARIKDASVDAVKQAADIVAVVEQRTPLRKGSGGRFTGRCPFHEERTPSFSISPDKGFYHCFGCGASGDTIRFVQETEGVDFVGAIEWLARRFNVQLEYEEASPEVMERRRERDRVLALLERAASFYERYLWESAGAETARAYLSERGLRENVCREFRLGLAPGGARLVALARDQGYTRDELLRAGLSNRRGNDYFSGRLVFPLSDASGHIVGFQARKLRDDDPLPPKYVNSPESDLFRKGAIVYGLSLARAAIAKGDRAIVVEGNTDVIALRQAGLEAVVACMGTALTEHQLRELGRRTKRLVLCFDGDAAGEAATLRGMELAQAQGFEVKVVALPPGTDPADSPAGFEALLPKAEAYARYRTRVELERAPDRQTGYQRVREFLNRLEDSPDRADAWKFANDRLGITVQLQAGVSASAGARPSSERVLKAGERLERDALAGVLAHAALLPVLAELGPEHFDAELHRRVRAHLLDREAGEHDAELVALLAELDARAAEAGIDEGTAEQTLLKLRERQLRRELASAGEDRLPDLVAALDKVRSAFRQLA